MVSDDNHWISTETGSHILLNEEGTIISGAGGKFNGKNISSIKSNDKKIGNDVKKSMYEERYEKINSSFNKSKDLNKIRNDDIEKYRESLKNYTNIENATSFQKMAISQYTGENYKKINEYARTGNGNGNEKEYQEIIDGCREYIEKNKLNEQVTLFRGLNKDIGIEPGKIMHIKGVASFTNSDIIARSFTEGNNDGVIMEIIGRPGDPAAPVNGYSSYGDEEAEYIMSPDTKLRCISKKRVGYKWLCQMEIV